MKRLSFAASVAGCLALAVVLAILAGCGGSSQGARPSRRAPTHFSNMPRPAQPAPSMIIQPPAMTAVPAAPGQTLPAQPVYRTVQGRTVILDAGHGGNDAGASHGGLREKDVNLDLAVRTASLLRARGVNVVMTRSADTFVPLPGRSDIANRHPNAVFVSIHCNSTDGNPEPSGVETFVLTPAITDAQRVEQLAKKYRAGGAGGVQGQAALATLATSCRAQGPVLAQSLQSSLCRRLGDTDRGVRQKDLAVLRETYFGPAALVEVGFMTNPRTAQMMRTDDWRRRTAEALSEGICTYLQQS